jgi:ABC-type dipeptide/oligopeptide/nickel transport system permease component
VRRAPLPGASSASTRSAWPSAPVVTVTGLQLGALLAGAVVTETIFAWPGIGRLVVQAIGARDYPLVQGCALVFGVTYVVVNACTDLLLAALDPRLRDAE